MQKKLHLYRYRDSIAINGDLFDNQTFYLNAAMCHMLSKALQDGVIDLLTNSKVDTKFTETYLTSNEVAV